MYTKRGREQLQVLSRKGGGAVNLSSGHILFHKNLTLIFQVLIVNCWLVMFRYFINVFTNLSKTEPQLAFVQVDGWLI